MAEDSQKPDQGSNPDSNTPSNPKPEVIDIGPRVVQHGENVQNLKEIIQDIEKRKG
jgi:hypothetical protein